MSVIAGPRTASLGTVEQTKKSLQGPASLETLEIDRTAPLYNQQVELGVTDYERTLTVKLAAEHGPSLPKSVPIGLQKDVYRAFVTVVTILNSGKQLGDEQAKLAMTLFLGIARRNAANPHLSAHLHMHYQEADLCALAITGIVLRLIADKDYRLLRPLLELAVLECAGKRPFLIALSRVGKAALVERLLEAIVNDIHPVVRPLGGPSGWLFGETHVAGHRAGSIGGLAMVLLALLLFSDPAYALNGEQSIHWQAFRLIDESVVFDRLLLIVASGDGAPSPSSLGLLYLLVSRNHAFQRHLDKNPRLLQALAKTLAGLEPTLHVGYVSLACLLQLTSIPSFGTTDGRPALLKSMLPLLEHQVSLAAELTQE